MYKGHIEQPSRRMRCLVYRSEADEYLILGLASSHALGDAATQRCHWVSLNHECLLYIDTRHGWTNRPSVGLFKGL